MNEYIVYKNVNNITTQENVTSHITLETTGAYVLLLRAAIYLVPGANIMTMGGVSWYSNTAWSISALTAGGHVSLQSTPPSLLYIFLNVLPCRANMYDAMVVPFYQSMVILIVLSCLMG